MERGIEMYLGNISNRQAPVICFDANVLFLEKRKETNPILTFFGKKLGGKEFYTFFNRETDQTAIDIINNIWSNYDFSVYIFMDNQLIASRLHDFLYENHVSYTRTISCDIEGLKRMCHNQFHLFVSKDAELISKLSKNNAILLQDLPCHMKLARRI